MSEQYHEWRCPDCPDWGCGSVDRTGMEQLRRLHCAVAHEGLSFREAIRTTASASQEPLSRVSFPHATVGGDQITRAATGPRGKQKHAKETQ